MTSQRIKTILPSPELRPYIERFWLLESEGDPNSVSRIKVWPTGHPEFLFHFGNPFRVNPGTNEAWLMPRATVGGQLKKPIQLGIFGRVRTLGVRFRPAGLYSLLGKASGDLTQSILSLSEAYGPLVSQLATQVLGSLDMPAAIRLLEAFFKQRLVQCGDNVVYAHHAVDFIWRNGGQVSVADVCRRMGIGERQVEREFKEKIGLSPKFFIRITRLNNALKLLKNHPTLSWANLAYECGYADQAHFINEFRAFLGESPRQYSARRQSALYYA